MNKEKENYSEKNNKKPSPKSRFSVIFFSVWTLLFLLFAYWQWNDPDPEIWVSIYFFAAIMCALAATGRYFVPVLALAAFLGLIGGLYFFPESVWIWISQEWQQADLSMKTIEMEEARESFGLLIISVIMALAAFTGWRKKRKFVKQQ